MKIAAIPTTRNGIRFRSRLEAKWSAFFDAAGWRWSYEPLDLNGWIPDFVLHLDKPILVEVKPALTEDELRAHCAKIDEAKPTHEVLLVGVDVGIVTKHPWDDSNKAIGLLREIQHQEPGETGEPKGWWDPALAFRCGGCGKQSFYHSYGWYFCRVSGCYDGDHHLGSDDWSKATMAAATNHAQWMPRQ